MSFHIGDVFTAIGNGAASVYHSVLATGSVVTAWESDPAVAPFVALGLDYANSALTRFGVPPGTVSIVGGDVLAALKALAALDPTVPSVATTQTTATATTATPPLA
jgi:hypothetical protein